MKRDDFVFTIGYEGNSAVVDSKAKRRYRKYGTLDLAKAGQHKAAFSAALYNEDEQEMAELLAYFRENTTLPADDTETLKRLFGVYGVPPHVTRVMMV
jgi:hypothetical protein